MPISVEEYLNTTYRPDRDYVGGEPASPMFASSAKAISSRSSPAPVLCIEVLSKDDTVRALEERIHDYLQFGVPTVWLIDPKTRLAFIYRPDGSRGVLRAANPGYPDIEIALSALFE
jgi:Uma2 family endonuclease